jgi:MHS family alpha-ketoglutarate permease-like MFS transporter
MASSGRRGFYSSFQYVTLVAGQLVALGVQIILQQILSEADMMSWGWRIPFVIGAMGALAVLWLRRTMDESEQFEKLYLHNLFTKVHGEYCRSRKKCR